MKSMNRVISAAILLALAAPASAPALALADAPAQQAVDELLATDRAFAAAAVDTDTVTALSAMFHQDVVMPLPGGTFARGNKAAIEALRANPLNSTSRARWTPIRAGISADGQHGFSLGYMTLTNNDGNARLAKYLAYWVRTNDGWRVAAYKRAPRPEGEVSLEPLAPSLPARALGMATNPAERDLYRISLIAAEQAFSDEAQRIGLGPAFRRNGRDDAINLGGDPSFVVGAEGISRAVADGSATSPVRWGADDALVASSGDLGVTFGVIRPNGPTPEGRPPASAFFTIWRRDSPDDPWRYIAE